MSNAKTAPNVFEYDDYRAFLADFYVHRKEVEAGFSFRNFARRAGLKSPNFLKLVIEGKRNLTEASLQQFLRALRMTRIQADFFSDLVLMSQTENDGVRDQIREKVRKIRLKRRVRALSEQQLNYYTAWYYIPLREMVTHPGFREDPIWIAQHMIPRILPSEAIRGIERLLEMGLLQRNDQGKLVQIDENITTGDEVKSEQVAEFHRSTMRLAAESFDVIPRELRDVSSITCSISEETAAKAKVLIQQFRKDLLAFCSQDAKAERVYQINFQFFPVTKKTSE
ncbi:MAG: TIGR02147 family protein [Bacteriovoracia bacterium]